MKVFISYSREDIDFVDRLSGNLVRHGFEPLVDRKELQALDDWKKQLGRFIRKADATVFVLSPDWVASEMCAWELETAQRLGKRLAPVVSRDPGADVPKALSSLQYIFFTDPNTVEGQADTLCAALQQDAAWSSAHTRYQDLAERWDELKQPDDHCLKGKELKEARRWLRKRPAVGAAPTGLQKQFIYRSGFINSLLYKAVQTIVAGIGALLAAVFRFLFHTLFKATTHLIGWTLRNWKLTLAIFVAIMTILYLVPLI